MAFQDRAQAGKFLANKLARYANRSDVLVLGLPRGGVPIALEVAKAIHAPLDVFLVRKLGVPGHEETAMGAIASGGVRVINDDAVRGLHIPDDIIDAVARKELQELKRREQTYRDDRPPVAVNNRVVILVDDGLATGSTMRAAAQAIRQQKPKRLVVAVPIGASETCDEFRSEVDDTICAVEPEPFYAVGVW
jgi:putative phosphoribosyl transferase